MSEIPSVKAEKYSPVPPHKIGRRPATAAISRKTSLRHHATLPASAAARTPYSACGTAASSANVGRAVTTRNSRYTCIASALITTPPTRAAIAIANADLPAQVGPATINALPRPVSTAIRAFQ